MNCIEKEATGGVRGSVTARVLGGLLMRLTGSDAWDFIALRGNDELQLLLSSRPVGPDGVLLRKEIRMQRFAGAVMPHASLTLVAEHGRSLCVMLGTFGTHIALMRLSRNAAGKPYFAKDAARVEPFIRQHHDALVASLFGFEDSFATLVARRAEPICFTVDGDGALIAYADDVEEEPSALHAQLSPAQNRVSPILRPFIADLLARYTAGARGAALATVLPFAILRLHPMRGRGVSTFLVSLEWLRGNVSLAAAAARYAVSKREVQVLTAMLRGLKVAEIANELSISDSTVIFHLKRLLKKTHSRNRSELAAKMLDYNEAATS